MTDRKTALLIELHGEFSLQLAYELAEAIPTRRACDIEQFARWNPQLLITMWAWNHDFNAEVGGWRRCAQVFK